MNIHYLLFASFFLLLFSCDTPSKEENTAILPPDEINEVHFPPFQVLLDSALLDGSILIYDESINTFYSNHFRRANTAYLPASTFKIPNSIIALETGIIEDENTLFKWDGKNRLMDIWEKDMNFKEAYQLSCVPCYQDIARNVGEKRMKEYLERLDFGKMQVDSNNLDEFWLQGASSISSFEQIDFLQRLNQSQLPISKKTESVMKKIMLLEQHDNYQLRGKTGWSIADDKNLGWFVAILESQGKTYYLATNVEPKNEFDMKQFPKIRKSISMEAFESLNAIQ